VRYATIARGHGPRSHGFESRSLPSRFGIVGSLRSGPSVVHCPLGRVRIEFRSERQCSAEPQVLRAKEAMREAAGFLPTGVLPNWSLEGTRTGMALGPRGARCHHPPRGPSATPALAPQLKR
jgi:hypothetical protein